MREAVSDGKGRGFPGELVAAWMVVLVVLAVGLTAIMLHKPGIRDRSLPQWHGPPIAGGSPLEDESMDLDETEMVSHPTAKNICNMIARSTSYAQAPSSGTIAHQSEVPC